MTPPPAAWIVPDGMISPMPQPALFGFSLNDFAPDSYLWRRGNEIMVSLIIARNPGKGAFSRLLRTIEASGFSVAVPCPLGHMEAILQHKGFVCGYEDDARSGERVEVWRRQQQQGPSS
jgi:hypothetical protein